MSIHVGLLPLHHSFVHLHFPVVHVVFLSPRCVNVHNKLFPFIFIMSCGSENLTLTFYFPNELRFFPLLILFMSWNVRWPTECVTAQWMAPWNEHGSKCEHLIAPIWETGLEGGHLWKVVIFLQLSWGEQSPARGPGGTLQPVGLR